VAGYLAHAHYALEDVEEAARFAALCADAAADDDHTSQALARTVRAKLTAREGDAESALHLAREAVGFLEPTDDINSHADRIVDLAKVLERIGRPADAAAALREALVLYERKANLVGAERTRSLLGASKPAP
jgi:hypothetical protein